MVRLKDLLHLPLHFLLKAASAVALAAAVTACGTASLGPGMTREQVVSRMGQPTRTVSLPAGGQRLQYSYQPYGQEAVMVDLDPSGRVVQVRQVLNESDFSRISTRGDWTRADVEREFGPPASVGSVGSWDGP